MACVWLRAVACMPVNRSSTSRIVHCCVLTSFASEKCTTQVKTFKTLRGYLARKQWQGTIGPWA